MGGEILDVLADTFKVQLHGIVDLTDFTVTAVYKTVDRFSTQIHDNERRDYANGKARDDNKRPGQLLFDVHLHSRILSSRFYKSIA
ncbi:hypothetical protein D3C87_1451980 [compost metagenome]